MGFNSCLNLLDSFFSIVNLIRSIAVVWQPQNKQKSINNITIEFFIINYQYALRIKIGYILILIDCLISRYFWQRIPWISVLNNINLIDFWLLKLPPFSIVTILIQRLNWVNIFWFKHRLISSSLRIDFRTEVNWWTNGLKILLIIFSLLCYWWLFG